LGHHRHLRSFPTRRSSDLARHSSVRFDSGGNLEAQLGAEVVEDLVAGARLPAGALGDGQVFDFGDDLERDEDGAFEGEDVLDVEDRKSTRLNSSHVKISYA